MADVHVTLRLRFPWWEKPLYLLVQVGICALQGLVRLGVVSMATALRVGGRWAEGYVALTLQRAQASLEEVKP